MVKKPLSLLGLGARWAQLSSFSWFPCSVGTAVGDFGCDPCQQHRRTCQIHNILHWAAGKRALFIGLTYTLLVVTFNVFSALKVLCSLQCTWLFMRGDLWLFSIAHGLRHTYTSVYNYASSRAVHSWQDLPMQENILLTVGCAVFNSNGESSVPGYSMAHIILARVKYF